MGMSQAQILPLSTAFTQHRFYLGFLSTSSFPSVIFFWERSRLKLNGFAKGLTSWYLFFLVLHRMETWNSPWSPWRSWRSSWIGMDTSTLAWWFPWVAIPYAKKNTSLRNSGLCARGKMHQWFLGGWAWLPRMTCVRSVPMLPVLAASEKVEKLMQDMSCWEVSAFLWLDHVLSPINIPGLHLPLQPNWSWQLVGTSLQSCSTWIRCHYQSSSASKEAVTPLRGAGTTEVVWYWNGNALCFISHYFAWIWTNWVKLSILRSLFNILYLMSNK